MSQIYNDLYHKLALKLDPAVLGQLVFINNHVEPEGFYEWSVKQRRAWRQTVLPHSDAPTKTNYWVWCGSYDGPAKTPQTHWLIVTRHIYSAMVAPVTAGNLRGLYALTRSDVNPWKYFPRMGLSRQQVALEYQQRTGENPLAPLQKNMDIKVGKAITDCAREINMSYIPNVLDTKQQMIDLMGDKYAPIVIERALEIVTVELKA